MHAHLSPSRIHLTKWLCYWNCLAPKEGGQFHVPSFPLPLRHSFPKVIQFGSVFQLCSMLCDPVDHSTPGLPVDHQLPEFTQTHVHRVGDAISSSVIPFFSCLQSCPVSGSFPLSQFLASGGQSIGASASASVLPMNIQD